jgi:prolyl-tRNA synthetase
MQARQFLILTYKEAPADAEVVSHKLMLRAGFIKKLSTGIYTIMPMGLRTIKKIENIVHQEMESIGAIPLTMPIIQPAELWQSSGRLLKMGDELLRITDRYQRSFIVQPTSEEVVTDIAKQDFHSYRQLPKCLYQIQTKFRDERRPRFGLLRGREFMMKDAYSFDKNEQDAKKTYSLIRRAYKRIFDRFGLDYRIVAADSGAIGGELSEEFQVIASTGEDAIVYCPQSSYAANLEKATCLPPGLRPVPTEPLKQIVTPDCKTCSQVAKLLDIALERTVKSIVLVSYAIEDQGGEQEPKICLILLRGDHTLNETKVAKAIGLEKTYRFATPEEISTYFGTEPGYIGPLNTKKPVYVIADREVNAMADWVCGANVKGYHIQGVNWGRDLPEPEIVADIRNVVAKDLSPDGQGELAIERGIELGHTFYLGTKYSQAMGATFLAEDGKPKFFEMGCYGIGISRLPAAAIEQNHDEQGIIWPDAIAPFTVVICPIGIDKSELVKKRANALYEELKAVNIDVILDDRGQRPGVMFADWELIGIPHRITIGIQGLTKGIVEYQNRKTRLSTQVDYDQVALFMQSKISIVNTV